MPAGGFVYGGDIASEEGQRDGLKGQHEDK